MKIVIDIPEEDYILAIKDDYRTIYGGMDSHIADAIKVGVKLPKDHGRLIDADEILRELGSYHIGGLNAIKNYNGENTWEDGLHTAWRVIDDAETIIPAESEE